MNRNLVITTVGLLAIIALAAVMRLWGLQHYPPGLFPDEAANGEDVLLILQGDWRPFYPRGNGREALFFYLQALATKNFGIGVWQMHLAPALIGIATVAATYFATRVWFGRVSGLMAALLLATSHWHVTLSRTGFRAMMIPLFVALVTGFTGVTIRAVRKQQWLQSYIYAALAGAAFAGGFYTYIAYRIMIGVVLGMITMLLLAALHPKIGFPHLKRYWQHLSIALVSGLVVIAPLGLYFFYHPDAFVGRAGQVSIFSPALQQEYGGGTLLGTLQFSTRETLLAFVAGHGDLNWRHNVAGFPLLNPLVGLLFLLGLTWVIHGTVVTFLKIIKGEELHLDLIFVYTLLLLAGMLVPVITTAESMPHGLRSVGLLFPIFFIAGTAGSVICYWVKRKVPVAIVQMIAYGGIAGLLILGLLYDTTLYHVIARNSAAAHYAYRADLTDVAAYLNTYHDQHPDGLRPNLVLDAFSLQTVHYLTAVAAHEYVTGDQPHPDEDQHKWIQIDPATSHLLIVEPGELIIFTQSTLPDADRYHAQHPTVELIESRRNRFNQEIMRIYRAAGGAVQGDTDRVEAGLDA